MKRIPKNLVLAAIWLALSIAHWLSDDDTMFIGSLIISSIYVATYEIINAIKNNKAQINITNYSDQEITLEEDKA